MLCIFALTFIYLYFIFLEVVDQNFHSTYTYDKVQELKLL